MDLPDPSGGSQAGSDFEMADNFELNDTIGTQVIEPDIREPQDEPLPTIEGPTTPPRTPGPRAASPEVAPRRASILSPSPTQVTERESRASYQPSSGVESTQTTSKRPNLFNPSSSGPVVSINQASESQNTPLFQPFEIRPSIFGGGQPVSQERHASPVIKKEKSSEEPQARTPEQAPQAEVSSVPLMAPPNRPIDDDPSVTSEPSSIFSIPVSQASKPTSRSQQSQVQKRVEAARAAAAARSSKTIAGPSGTNSAQRNPAHVQAENANSLKKRRLSTGSGRMSSGRPADHEGQWVQDDPELVDVSMRDNEDDHSWMQDPVDVDEDYKRMLHLRDLLQKKQRSGKMSGAEQLELFKVQEMLRGKERLRDAIARGLARDDAEESPLFVQQPPTKESREDAIRRHRNQARHHQNNSDSPEAAIEIDDDEDDEDESSPIEDPDDPDAAFLTMLSQELTGKGIDKVPTEKELDGKSRKPRAKKSKVALNAREFVAKEREKEREKERAKAQRKKNRKQASPAARGRKPAAKGKVTKGKGKATKKSGNSRLSVNDGDEHASFAAHSRNGEDSVAQMILDDLMNHDPISDRLQNPIFNTAPEPVIEGLQKKSTQFEILFSNIPEGSSKQTAASDRQKLLQASKAFGFAKVKAVDGKWKVKGMNSTLYHHQLLGAQWMLGRELAGKPPAGGLLTDAMGLGKTVQTLACMIGNPPQAEDIDRGCKATLIVVPSAVVDQWMDEIRHHAEEKSFPKILHYKASKKIPMAILLDLDIVICSYHEIMHQFPFPDKEGRHLIAKMGHKKWWHKAQELLGDLHKVTWYRVVLDEAHAIKNNSGRTSLACQNLKSIYRWCLTGTPLLNRLEELFPYLRFLKANYSMDWKTFQRRFCDPEADDCHARIATLLSYTMMRRTMKTTILNRPIITLPKPHPSIQYVDFSTEERIIYRITENRFRSNLNAYFAQKSDVRHNYSIFLVQLLRLRQCTSHPFMLERTIKEAWTSEDIRELEIRIKRHKKGASTSKWYEQCKLWVMQSEEDRAAIRQATLNGEEVPEHLRLKAMPFGQSDYGNSFHIEKVIGKLSEADMYARVVCCLCSDLPMNPQVTECGHIFCKECLDEYMHHRAAEYEDGNFECPSCDRLFEHVTPYRGAHVSDDDGSPQPSSPSNAASSSSNRGKGKNSTSTSTSKGRDAMGFEPMSEDSTWVQRSDTDADFPLLPSTKTAALKAILLKGFRDAPRDKVVIYVQFRLLARIVGRICAGEKWGFLYLTGDSTLDHRNKVVKRFRSDPDVMILIAGLKCGGIGLNFPWANRCISLDLWWNHAVEQQAFSRIFRIGQAKETHMTRIVVRNSVDMRLLSMQMYKLKTCERAMNDSNDPAHRKDKNNLTLRDLARLFGFLRTDEDGEVVGVVPDYNDGDDVDGEGEGEGGEGGSGGGGEEDSFMSGALGGEEYGAGMEAFGGFDGTFEGGLEEL